MTHHDHTGHLGAEIARLGAAVASGAQSWADAVDELMDLARGTLHRRGAELQLRSWRSAVSRYAHLDEQPPATTAGGTRNPDPIVFRLVGATR